MESTIYWVKDILSSSFTCCPPPPLAQVFQNWIQWFGYWITTTNLGKYTFLLPEYCGMLCVHLHNFVFVLRIWKLGLQFLLNNNNDMYVYGRLRKHTHTHTHNLRRLRHYSISSLPLVLSFKFMIPFGGGGKGRGTQRWAFRAVIIVWMLVFRPSVLWLIVICMSVFFPQWFRAVSKDHPEDDFR